VVVIGGGLAGCEAAFQAAEAGCDVVLYEMRPQKQTAAHKTAAFGELVCSNSLKTEQPNSAPWLLKEECRRLHSLLLNAAEEARVPGGHALTVDRGVFSAAIARVVAQHPRIEVRREEVTAIPENGIVIVASVR
jgi:methylenetetrahydrofolate--tRNA-(uracil-5-)-methyltransferase